MIALVMTACLAAAPSACHDERLLLDMPVGLCVIVGQRFIAEWAGDHPIYRVRPGWRCELARSERPA